MCLYVEKIYVVAPKKDEQIWIPELDGPNLRQVDKFRFFRCKKVTYIWDAEQATFFNLKMLDSNVPINYYHLQTGLSKEEQFTRFVRHIMGGCFSLSWQSSRVLHYKQLRNVTFSLQENCLWAK